MKNKRKYLYSHKLLIPSMLILNSIIILVSFWYYKIEKDAFINQEISQLRSIADIKIGQIVDWRNERLSDARYLSVSPQIKECFVNFLSDPSDQKYHELLRNNLNGMFLNGKYESMVAYDREGRMILSLPPGFPSIEPEAGTAISDSIRMDDFVHDVGNNAIIKVTIPQVLRTVNDTLHMGSIVMNINFTKSFLPLLKAIPVPAKTMEVLLLFHKDEDNLMFNPAGMPHKTVKKFTRNLKKAEDDADISKNAGFYQLSNNEPVLAVSYPIPGSNSFLLVKIDKAEAYAEVVKLRYNLIALSGLMILAFTSSVSFFLLRHRNEIMVLEAEKKLIMERFDMLSKFSNDAIIVYTRDLTILQVNDKALELYGYSRDEFLGMNAELLRSPEARPGIKAALDTTAREGGFRFETTHIRKDGNTFPVEVSLRYVELMDSLCYQALVRDIKQRKQFEKALIDSEQRLRLITNIMPQVVWTARPDGSFDFVNSRFELLTGTYPLKESATADFIHADDRDRVITYWKNAISDIREHQIRFRVKMKDESFRWFLCMAIPMCDENGEVIRWYGSGTDIDELESIVAQRTEELEAFTFSVSHDLRAPLRAINGYSQILLDEYGEKLDPEGNQLIEKVLGNSIRMRQLIEDLLRLSRASRQELNHTLIDMEALFNSMLEEIRQQFPDKTIHCNINPMPGIFGDLALLKQVISNLLSNAVKFSSQQNRTEIEAGYKDGFSEHIFFIKDNGTGFDMQFAAELFGVFRRLSNADDYEGTGVGLALVKRIIDKHDGRVWAESEPGKGATFYFSLPVSKTP